MLSQVLVKRAPNRLAAGFARKIQAKNKATIGPVPGIIPENTPKPRPNAILRGLSLILKSFVYSFLLQLIFKQAFQDFTSCIFR